MLYKEMNYTQKREYEATLTIGQRAKLRRMEKQFKEQIQPIMWASHAREEELRREAWVNLEVAKRIKDLEDLHAPEIASLREKIQELQKELTAVTELVSEARSEIQTQPYQIASDDPEVKAMRAIWRKTKEVQTEKVQELIDSFKVKVSE